MWNRRGLHIALLVGLCVGVYVNALGGEFVWDDNVQIVRNESIRSLDNIPHAFTSSLWSFASSNVTSNDRYYRPLQTVIFTLAYTFGGLSPAFFHGVSLALHVLATIMVYLVCVELGLVGSACLFAAAVFAVHPVHTEAVSWIAGAGEVACGLLYFTALWAFIRYGNTKRWRWLGISMLCFFLALFAKEMAVTFPFAAMLVLGMRRREWKCGMRDAVVSVSPFFIVLALYAAIRLSVVGFTLPPTFQDHASVFDWITFAIWMFGRYLRYALVPYPLAILHLVPLYFFDRVLSTCLYALAVASAAGLLWIGRKAVPAGVWWFSMFAAMLAPVFYFKGISGGSVFSERYLYIPTLPAILLLVTWWAKLERKVSIIAAVGVIVVFSGATIARNRDWRNDEALYVSSLNVYPTDSYACLNLSAVYLDEGKYEEAQKCLDIAEQHMGDSGFTRPEGEQYRLEMELGTLAARRSLSAEAKTHLEKAMKINPTASDTYTIMAGVMMNLDKDFASAIPMLEKAIEFGPADDQARDSMGVALYNLKRYDEAVVYFQEALRINPQSTRAQQHLQTALKRVAR